MTTIDYSKVEEYVEFLGLHGRRPSTLKNNRMILRRVVRTLAEGGRPTDPTEISEDDAWWLYAQLSSEMTESTLRLYFGEFSRWSEHFRCPHWSRTMDILYNRTEPTRVWITIEDFAELYRQASETDRLILVLGAFMGLRRMEIAGLRDEDIDLRWRTMTIRGKGHGPNGLVEHMEIPEEVVDEIRRLRAAISESGHPRQDDRVVQAYHNGRWESLNPNRIYIHLKELGARTGIRVTTHALRRLYATTLVNDVGADFDTVRRLMRHADITTTLRCYVNADPRRMMAAQSGLVSILHGAISSI